MRELTACRRAVTKPLLAEVSASVLEGRQKIEERERSRQKTEEGERSRQKTENGERSRKRRGPLRRPRQMRLETSERDRSRRLMTADVVASVGGELARARQCNVLTETPKSPRALGCETAAGKAPHALHPVQLLIQRDASSLV